MDIPHHLASLTNELEALKDRVRNLIDDAHWPTDGEWKESVLRTMLRRHLPDNVHVGRGFAVKPGQASTQIDVLLYDASYPVLHRDGDLVIVTADAVRGVIEVKTSIDMAGLQAASEKLSNNAEFVLVGRRGAENEDPPEVFVGLFAYDGSIGPNDARTALNRISSAARHDWRRVINHVSVGSSFFVRFWASSPYDQTGIRDYQKWHCYELSGKAPGYFINNVIAAAAHPSVRANEHIWFPQEGKEAHKLAEMPLRDTSE